MNSQLLLKFSLKKLLICLSLIILSYEQQQCISGKNCPLNQGECISGKCVCNTGYQTLLAQSTPIDQQIYCNYKQISQYTPIILEIFLPSIGHFTVGNYWLGLIKISLLLTYVISSYIGFGKLEPPELWLKLMEKIGIAAFLNVSKNENARGNASKILIIAFDISGVLISLMYFADLFCYKLGVYNDGYGFPFV
jgi:hypothetical protein